MRYLIVTTFALGCGGVAGPDPAFDGGPGEAGADAVCEPTECLCSASCSTIVPAGGIACGTEIGTHVPAGVCWSDCLSDEQIVCLADCSCVCALGANPRCAP